MESSFLIAVYVIYFFLAIGFSIALNLLFLRFAATLGIRDLNQIQEIRWSSTVKPSLGGMSFFILFLISISVVGILPFENSLGMAKQLFGIVAACALGFMIGLADDGFNTNPLVKFIGQMTCGFILITADIYIEISGIPSVDFVFTTVWVIGLMNSINMLDNMDGVTGSISSSIISGALILILLTNDLSNPLIILLIGVLGALLGFLVFNWNPSKIYMGDTGTQFLGVFLSVVSILFLWNFREPYGGIIQLKQFVFPLLIFIVPLIDTTTVVVRRIMRGQSPFVGGKDHITHHLAYLGLSDRMVATVLLIISVISIPLVASVFIGGVKWTFGYTIFGLLYFVLAFIIIQILYNIGKQKSLEKK